MPLLFSQLDMTIVSEFHDPSARQLARGSDIVHGEHTVGPASLLII
jgi:hypothetical protein